MHQCSIDPIRINGIELTCKKDDHGQPCVICNKQRRNSVHTELFSLIKEVPELNKDSQLMFLATLANFLFKGEEFEIISDPHRYRQEYKEQVEKEQNSFDLPLSPLITYGIFDVEEISTPHVNKKTGKKHDQLVFYVVKKIPYKVTCDFPIDRDHPQYKYEMLEEYMS